MGQNKKLMIIKHQQYVEKFSAIFAKSHRPIVCFNFYPPKYALILFFSTTETQEQDLPVVFPRNQMLKHDPHCLLSAHQLFDHRLFQENLEIVCVRF